MRALAGSLDLPELLAGLLVNRGQLTADSARSFMHPSVDELRDPFGLADMDKAADRLAAAIVEREPVLIYGDADVDGLSGTALLVQFLRTLGLQPSVHVPNRAFGGYSFTPEGVAAVLAAGARVVVSVDNGTTATGPVADLQRAGVDVIVTDHHLPGPELPPAFALVNPRRADCPYPFKGLAGVGVAFKLACATASRLHARQQASDAMGRFLGEALAWVALGTVSDVMPLQDENRILVARGLAALPRTRCAGLAALCGVAGLGPGADAMTEDIAFRLAPRLNAASRMGRTDLSVELVLATDPNRARQLAEALDGLNRDRQAAERELLGELESHVAGVPEDEPVVLAAEHWNAGLLGLVAGRLARRRGLPAVLIAHREGGPAKGSCRSIVGFDVHAALAACEEHLEAHGGHAMAAGFTVAPERIEAFTERFREVWQAARSEGLEPPPLEYEGELPLAALTPGLIATVERLRPFGEGNRRPVLGTMGVTVQDARRMGGGGAHLQMRVGQGPTALRAVAFHRGELADSLRPGQSADLLFTPKLNRWRGRADVELELVDVRDSPPGG